MLVLGIDVGTQGARVLACDRQGTVLAQSDEAFTASFAGGLPDRWSEQDPAMWWQALTQALRRLVAELDEQGLPASTIEALAITSTSGTVVAIDQAGRPLRPALMYNDGRAQEEAQTVQQAGQQLAAELGYRFSPAFALSKILWLRRHQPELFDQVFKFVHAADYVAGCLSGQFSRTDYSNALKTGYDLLRDEWPAFIEDRLEIPLSKLPVVVAPCTPIAAVSRQAAEATGLPVGVPILAGMTDGCASQVSTGAVAPGDWCTTLGTTLVIKGVTRSLLLDPEGRIYSHKSPDGYWLPGGASNTGGEAIAQRFPRPSWEKLNQQAMQLSPTGVVMYPLARHGERFPFARPQAEGFTLGQISDEAVDYTAHLEGVGYLERLAYEMLQGLGGQVGDTIFNAGGGTHSTAWTQIRADVLQRSLARPQISGGAMGAALLAAAGTWYPGIVPAARAMVRIVERVSPRGGAWADAYDQGYRRFRQECLRRGYVQ